MKFSRSVAAVFTATSLLVPSAYAQDGPGAANPPETPVSQPDATTRAPSTNGALVPLKVVQATVTGYATGGDGGAIGDMTASGVHTHWGTVAADWHLYPLGTRLQIEGFPNDVFTVEDTGGAVVGNVFDVWFPDLPAAAAFGTRSLRVTVLAN
jgi:3D (Asp-Asp-Asp) domain-containing protein